MEKTRIVIVGGGFGGVKCARTLRSILPDALYDIVVFNRENHMVFHPLLAEVVGASIDPDVTGATLRQLLPGVHCRTAEVRAVDLDAQELEFVVDDGRIDRVRYDHLVLASGTGPNVSAVPGMSDHAYPLKTVGDALTLRNHVLECLERAEVLEDDERRRWHLSFIIIGGGFSGVEVAGEINDLLRSSRRYFENVPKHFIAVHVIHAHDQLLPEVGARLREFARIEMEKAGIHMHLRERVSHVTRDGVRLQSGTFIAGATVVSTVGNAPLPFIDKLELPKRKGRLEVEPDMRVPGYDNVWSIGDCAVVPNAWDGNVAPATGQFAERQGKQVAQNIARVERGVPTEPFHFRPLGTLCSIGGRSAVAELLGVHLRGFWAWFAWRSVYLMKLPSWSRRVKVAFDWTWELMFSRELSHLKADTSERVGHAFFSAGDMVFERGDPSSYFYVIENGEAEVVGPSENGETEVVALLGPGDFFGEMALIDERPHRRGVRARTPLELVFMGKTVFEDISTSLGPLREILANTIRRRTDIWQHLPTAHRILKDEPLQTFVEPLKQTPLRDDLPIRDVPSRFAAQHVDFFFVVDEHEQLVGMMTRTDLLRSLEIAASRPERLRILVRDVMAASLVFITEDTSTLDAVSLMRSRGVKKLPVVASRDDRRLRGYVRIETFMDFVLRRYPEILPAAQAD